jgi:hypothetical protein
VVAVLLVVLRFILLHLIRHATTTLVIYVVGFEDPENLNNLRYFLKHGIRCGSTDARSGEARASSRARQRAGARPPSRRPPRLAHCAHACREDDGAYYVIAVEPDSWLLAMDVLPELPSNVQIIQPGQRCDRAQAGGTGAAGSSAAGNRPTVGPSRGNSDLTPSRPRGVGATTLGQSGGCCVRGASTRPGSSSLCGWTPRCGGLSCHPTYATHRWAQPCRASGRRAGV